MSTCELSGKPDELLGETLRRTGIPIQGGGSVLLVASHDGNRVKLPGYLALVQNLLGTDIACVSIITGKQFSL